MRYDPCFRDSQIGAPVFFETPICFRISHSHVSVCSVDLWQSAQPPPVAYLPAPFERASCNRSRSSSMELKIEIEIYVDAIWS